MPVARSSRFGTSRGSSGSAKARAGGNRLGEAHQGNCDGGGPHLRHKCELRRHELRQTGRHCPHRGNTGIGQSQQRGTADSNCHCYEWCRETGNESLDADYQYEHDYRHQHGSYREVRQRLEDVHDVAKESRLLDVYAQKFRELVDDDHEPDPGFETNEDWLGDEVRHEAEAQERPDRSARGPPGRRASRPLPSAARHFHPARRRRASTPTGLQSWWSYLHSMAETSRAAHRPPLVRARCTDRPEPASRQSWRMPSPLGPRLRKL